MTLAFVAQVLNSLEFASPGVIDLSRSLIRIHIAFARILYWIAIVPFLLAVLGKWVGGNAELSEVRQAIAWSSVPTTVAGLCWLPLTLAYFLARPDTADSEVELIVLQMMGVSSLWSLSILISTLAEVQQFSSLRAIACIVVVSIPSFYIARLSAWLPSL